VQTGEGVNCGHLRTKLVYCSVLIDDDGRRSSSFNCLVCCRRGDGFERHKFIISFDDICRWLVPLRDHSVAEKVLPDIEARSMFLQLILVASSTVMETIQLKEAHRVNILIPSQYSL